MVEHSRKSQPAACHQAHHPRLNHRMWTHLIVVSAPTGSAAMRSRKTSASSKSHVGYRRPPKATRFKKGKSGNPRGRPKGSRDIGNVLLDVTRQKIPVTENGRTRRMPALEVMLRKLTNEAIQNDQGALKLL